MCYKHHLHKFAITHLFECAGEEVNKGEAEDDPQDPAPPQQPAQNHGAGWVSTCTDQIRWDRIL